MSNPTDAVQQLVARLRHCPIVISDRDNAAALIEAGAALAAAVDQVVCPPLDEGCGCTICNARLAYQRAVAAVQP